MFIPARGGSSLRVDYTPGRDALPMRRQRHGPPDKAGVIGVADEPGDKAVGRDFPFGDLAHYLIDLCAERLEINACP